MKVGAHWLLEHAPLVSVGVLTADLLRLGAELDALDDANVQLVHVDVMDGVFCPSLTAGPPLVRAIPDSFVKDVHLMIDEPLEKVASYVEAGANILTFHLEATRHPHRVLQVLGDADVVRGLALSPGTSPSAAESLLDEVDLLLLLAVNPGFGGQRFIRSTEQRIEGARTLLRDRPIALGVDGGITKENVEHVASLGIDLIVTGSAVYDGGSPGENACFMRDAIARARPRGSIAHAGRQ